jgi:hypothetical protein
VILDVKVNPVMKSALKPAIGKYTFEKLWLMSEFSANPLLLPDSVFALCPVL